MDRDTGAVLSWTCVDPDEDDTLSYDIYIGEAANPPVADSGVAQPTYRPRGLEFSTLYRWRVVARDRHGFTSSGPVWTFRTARLNHPPNRPSLPVPDSGAQGWPVRTKLYWSGGDADTADSVTYDVYFGTTLPPPLVSQRTNDTSHAPGPLDYVTIYYWKVVAHDDHGATTEGPVWRFTTSANSPPSTPSNPRPASGALNQLLRPTLSWVGGDPDTWDVVRYDIYLGTSTAQAKVDSNRLVDSIVVGRLGYDTTYYWRVVARDDHGGTTQGPLWQFRTISPLRVTAPESLDRLRALSTYTVTWTGGSPARLKSAPSIREPAAMGRVPARSTAAVGSSSLSRWIRPASRMVSTDSPLAAPDSAVVSFSTDNGSSWLRQGRTTQPGRYDWTIPYAPTTNARLRVVTHAAGDTYSTASGRFTVYDTLAPSVLVVTAPNASSRWTIGNARDVTWTGGTDGFDSAVVFYSPDSQRSWIRQGMTTRPGIFSSWAVPGPASSNAYVLVRAWCRTRAASDTSDRFVVLMPPYPDSVVATVRVGGQPRALCWDSLDNRVYVANYTDSSVMVIDSTNQVEDTISVPKFPLAMVWNRSSNKLFVACELNAVAIINCATNTVVDTIGAARPLALCLNSTNNKIYVANNRDSSVTIIDGQTNSVIAQVRVGSSPNALDWSPASNKVYVANSASNTVSIIDGVSNAVIWTEPVGYVPGSVTVDARRNRVYVGNRTGNSVTVIDGGTNRAIRTIAMSQEPWALAWNETQSQVYCAASAANNVGVIDTLHNVVRYIGVGVQPRSLVWAGYVNKLYVANSGSIPGTVSLVDCVTNSVTKTLVVGSRPTAILWNPLSNRIYVANQDAGTVSVVGP